MRSDLSLLAVFDVLFEQGSVTKAAERLGLTQSAVSHALRRLREMTGDQLFARAGGRLLPTPRARIMAPAVRGGLQQLQEALLVQPFAPETSQRSFTVAAASYFCTLLIPELIARIRVQAPSIAIRIISVRSDMLTGLDQGSIDLGLGTFSNLPPRLESQTLFRERLVWIAAKSNPIIDMGLDHQQLLQNPHLALDPSRTFEPLRTSFIEDTLERYIPARETLPQALGYSKSTPVGVYDAITAISVVARTSLLGLVPRRLALLERNRFGIALLESGDENLEIDLSMVFRRSDLIDEGLKWIREQVICVLNDVSESIN